MAGVTSPITSSLLGAGTFISIEWENFVKEIDEELAIEEQRKKKLEDRIAYRTVTTGSVCSSSYVNSPVSATALSIIKNPSYALPHITSETQLIEDWESLQDEIEKEVDYTRPAAYLQKAAIASFSLPSNKVYILYTPQVYSILGKK